MIIGCQRIPFLPELAYLHCWSQKRRWKQFSSGNDLSTSSLQTAMKSFISLLSESWSCTPLVSISCSHFCRSLDSSLLRDFISTLCWSSLVRRFSQVIKLFGVPVCTKFLDGLSLRLLSRSLLFLESTSHILTWLAPTSYHKHSTVFCSNTWVVWNIPFWCTKVSLAKSNNVCWNCCCYFSVHWCKGLKIFIWIPKTNRKCAESPHE